MSNKDTMIEFIMVATYFLAISLAIANAVVGYIGDAFRGHEQFYIVPKLEITLVVWVVIMSIIYIKPFFRWIIDNSKPRKPPQEKTEVGGRI